MAIIAGTGHRPEKLFVTQPYSDYNFNVLTSFAESILKFEEPTKVISGMALGWDQALAQAAINLNIPCVAAIPFAGQEYKWPLNSQLQYNQLLLKMSEIVIVCEGTYAAYKMQIRNEWMINNSDLLIALWDGSKGGTGNCINSAKKKQKLIKNYWSEISSANKLYELKELVRILSEHDELLTKINSSDELLVDKNMALNKLIQFESNIMTKFNVEV
jgi:uncharacterized phage-like protein YoqJ